ncbi:hypothetical protein C1752_01860 [Acaryochloris thomasi RCC1774]|uniref:Microbial-type PARG catalytic domain-containing protein n=1 Tax=Acaryochloris thomasi RCC1774 TaxID=1764569 RepID=A0A2W1JVQ9_9CYAN|nr:hypothetical protein [Acaryochloris thomasi]PZD73814.1 hypothetical protein C1752_01860 [Acaryochloris thomasi RCC1774]
MWFEELTGFREESPEQVRNGLTVSGNTITSKINGRTMTCGRLETPTLSDLRAQVSRHRSVSGQLKLHEIVGDAKQLHIDVANAGALFQVASQFNLLEMVSPSVTPEAGVGIYGSDPTQGPACAIASGAGTIYRNYFAHVNGQIGQSTDNQIDCLLDVGQALDNTNERLWKMQNGYALASEDGLIEISKRIGSMSEVECDALRQTLRIGIQWDTQVTLANCKHTVTQAYCSALPVAYSPHPETLWADFARLVLEASYEATLCAALLNFAHTGNNQVFLTLIGGGVFGNRDSWIFAAIQRALQKFTDADLDVAIVSYGASKTSVRESVSSWQR